ncbi:M4 family metallopeptidase [Streptomyces sp. NBC_00989]|uniref:M4 family metallopeptidase n=1 Tax=Streptomyces sp. NBC_00989 TaxID=2903705 RepID=UPI00386C0EF3|nr:M4 family metallopeptidase [Streptomyces sp. NBC_00989]
MRISPVHCSFVPPHVLYRLLRASDPGLAALARRTLETDAVERVRREMSSRVGAVYPDLAAGVPGGHAQRTVYDARHRTDLPGRKVRSEGDAPGRSPAADRVYACLGAVHDFLSTAFERNSLDGQGLRLNATVHYGEGYGNAFWNGEQLVFGDGDGDVFSDFTVPVDVVGHELAHGLIQHTAGLAYSDQPGALNESIADVFASLIKQYTLGQTVAEADWLIGAGLVGPRVTGVALRSLKAPGTAYDDTALGRDPQPATMDDFVRTSRDNGGVHINSGIPNHAFYLLATELGGHAWEKAGQIWYDALTGGELRRNASFAEFANLTVSAAEGRYGRGDEFDATRKVWEQVGVLGSGPRTAHTLPGPPMDDDDWDDE